MCTLHVTEEVGGRSAVGVVACGAGMNLNGGVDRQLLDQASVLIGAEVLSEWQWQE